MSVLQLSNPTSGRVLYSVKSDSGANAKGNYPLARYTIATTNFIENQEIICTSDKITSFVIDGIKKRLVICCRFK